MQSLKERIMSRPALKERSERVEEWDETVILREPDGECRALIVETIGSSGVKGKEDSTAQASAFIRNAGKLLQPCIIDPDTGEPVFGPDEHAELGKCNPGVLQRLFLLVVGLAGLTDEADKEIKVD